MMNDRPYTDAVRPRVPRDEGSPWSVGGMIMVVMIACVLLVVGWLTFPVPPPPEEPVPAVVEQIRLQQQLDGLHAEMGVLKREVEELRQLAKQYKREQVLAKGRVLQAEQELHKLVAAALAAEPVPPIRDDRELMQRARALGLTTVVFR